MRFFKLQWVELRVIVHLRFFPQHAEPAAASQPFQAAVAAAISLKGNPFLVLEPLLFILGLSFAMAILQTRGRSRVGSYLSRNTITWRQVLRAGEGKSFLTVTRHLYGLMEAAV